MSSAERNKLVDALKTSEHATEALEALKNGILDKESPPQFFLNYAQGNQIAAAQRLAYYWEERKLVLGSNYLQPLEECLTEQHHKWLAMDVAFLLPDTDREGRRVLLASPYHGQEALLLCRFVAMHQLMMERVHEHPKGMVLIRIADPAAQFDVKWAQRSQHLFKNCFPVTLHHMRLLVAGKKTHLRNTILPMAFAGLGKDLSERSKPHVETNLTRMQSHLSDILEAHQLPVWLGGTWNRELDQALSCEDLLPALGNMVEHVSDSDLEKEMRLILQKVSDDATDDLTLEETMLVEFADTIRARRRAAHQEAIQLEATFQLVLGVTCLLLDESPGLRLNELLQDDLTDEILRDLWTAFQSTAVTSTPDETETTSSGSKDPVDGVVQAIVQVQDEQFQSADPANVLSEDKVNELHAKFRSALKLLSLLQEEDVSSLENPLENKDQLALVCQLVDLPVPSKSDPSSLAECHMDRLADRLVQQQSFERDIPEWLVHVLPCAHV